MSQLWLVGWLFTVLYAAMVAFAPAPAVMAAPRVGEGGQGDDASHSQATDLSALHRNGQTFLTWTERADLAGELYRVYRSNQRITETNLLQATPVYTLPEGSVSFYANRYNKDYSGAWQYRYLERLVIQDGAGQLPAGVGLLVWTLAASDFANGASGQAYYAVTVVQGSSETLSAGYSLDAPVSESVAEPLPVEPNVNVGAGGHLYIQYMDLRRWNPTFHAPNATNLYYGLNLSGARLSHAVQYAYDYVIYQPTAALCNGTIPAQVPVFVNLHGYGSNTYPPLTSHPDPYWCAYAIYPVDVTETWYFGFARDQDYRSNSQPVTGDTIVNYTEQRVMRMIYDLIRNPPGPAVDQQRIYVWGHSMGASGALALAMRYPDVFAAAYASEPMTNYSTSAWQGNVAPKWGSPSLNLPVSISGPSNWADHLQRYNGSGVWTWHDHQQNLMTRQADAMAPFGVGHGRSDTNIAWSTQGQPAYAAFNASRQAWGGMVTNDEHTWLSFQGLPPNLQPDSSLIPFASMRVVRDESVPGLSNASANLSLPPTANGGYNQTLRWSSSWDAWDGAPVDTTFRYQISLCSVSTDPPLSACGTGAAQTVDVTPRRLQHFPVTAGAVYTWENRSLAGALVASGAVTADGYGLVTVPGFSVSPAGNRLILTTADEPRFIYMPAVLKLRGTTQATVVSRPTF